MVIHSAELNAVLLRTSPAPATARIARPSVAEVQAKSDKAARASLLVDKASTLIFASILPACSIIEEEYRNKQQCESHQKRDREVVTINQAIDDCWHETCRCDTHADSSNLRFLPETSSRNFALSRLLSHFVSPIFSIETILELYTRCDDVAVHVSILNTGAEIAPFTPMTGAISAARRIVA